MSKDKDTRKVESLTMGESCTVNWFEEGGGLIFNCHGVYVLFQVTAYGTNEYYEETYMPDNISEMIDKAHSWT